MAASSAGEPSLSDGFQDLAPYLPTAILAAKRTLLLPNRDLVRAMEQVFKLGNFKVHLDDACKMPQNWTTEWKLRINLTKYNADAFLPHMILKSPFVTNNWQYANASLVVLFVSDQGGVVVAPERCRRSLMKLSPAFRANAGSKHFFVMPSDRGPCCDAGVVMHTSFLRHHIIGNHGEIEGSPKWKVPHGPSADLPCFVPYKDISIPPTAGAISINPPAAMGKSKKDLLVFYAGHGLFARGVRQGRQALLNHWEGGRDALIQVHGRISAKEYKSLISRARFCPIMGGFAPWTPRLTEAIMFECVPVFFSNWLPPFSRILNWSRFSVRVDSLDKIPQLKEIVLSQNYTRLATHLRSVRSAFWYRLHGGYKGDDMLPFLLLEMYLARREADAQPLDQRAEKLIGLYQDDQSNIARLILQSLNRKRHAQISSPCPNVSVSTCSEKKGDTIVLTNHSGSGLKAWQCRGPHQHHPPRVEWPYDTGHLYPDWKEWMAELGEKALIRGDEESRAMAGVHYPKNPSHHCRCQVLGTESVAKTGQVVK